MGSLEQELARAGFAIARRDEAFDRLENALAPASSPVCISGVALANGCREWLQRIHRRHSVLAELPQPSTLGIKSLVATYSKEQALAANSLQI